MWGKKKKEKEKSKNLCLICAKRNTVACPYGDNRTCISCDGWVLIGFGNYSSSSSDFISNLPSCPRCGVKEFWPAYGTRKKCRHCGSIFT